MQQAYAQPFSLQSDYARKNTLFVAMAASKGLITTRVNLRTQNYGTLWRVTKEGLRFLERD